MANTKAILITGATGLIGRKLVEHFLKTGYWVISTSRKAENIEALSQNLSTTCSTNQLVGIAMDLEKENAHQIITDYLHSKNLRPTGLINCARNSEHLIVDKNSMPPRLNWIGEFLLDVVVPYELSIALAHHSHSRLESIVNISSMYGVVPPNPGLYSDSEKGCPVHYGVAKAALIHLTKELAVRLAEKDIRVNCISFGGIRGRMTEDFERRYANFCPQGRMLNEEEVVGAVDFLISENSTGITGHNLIVDGGWSVW